MDKKKLVNDLEPEFPAQIFAVMIFIRKNGDEMGAYPLKEIFLSELEIKTTLESLKVELGKNNVSFVGAVTLPLYFLEKFPLKREFWNSPSQDYQGTIRSDFFVKVLKSPRLYKLLVLPEHYDEKKQKWWLKASVPFYLTADVDTIEKFMRTANDIVDVRAKSAGIYSFGEPKGLEARENNEEMPN